MKRIGDFIYNIVLVISALFLVQACSLENFSQPLPVDKSNSYVFPEIIRGHWLGEDSEHVFISTTFLEYTNNENFAVVKGVWPKKDDSGRYKYPPSGYFAENYQHFDSLNNPTDTAIEFIITKNRIYRKDGERNLSVGYSYITKRDTFFVNQRDTVWLDMGRNMFIRDLGKGLFALNINNGILGQDSRWWQLALLQVTNKDTISYWGVSEKMKSLPVFLHYFEERYFSAGFYECNFTSAEIRKYMREGYFEHKGFFTRTAKSNNKGRL